MENNKYLTSELFCRKDEHKDASKISDLEAFTPHLQENPKKIPYLVAYSRQLGLEDLVAMRPICQRTSSRFQ